VALQVATLAIYGLDAEVPHVADAASLTGQVDVVEEALLCVHLLLRVWQGANCLAYTAYCCSLLYLGRCGFGITCIMQPATSQLLMRDIIMLFCGSYSALAASAICCSRKDSAAEDNSSSDVIDCIASIMPCLCLCTC